MKMSSIKALASLGLNLRESRIYLGLLELGNATVQELAKKTGLKRTTLYFILEDLKRREFVYQTKTKKHITYIAEEPKNLLEEFKKKVDKFSGELTFLETIKNKGAQRPAVYFFESSEGFKKIWQIILRPETKEYLIITDPREMLSFVKKGYITEKIIKDKVGLGIKSRQLIASSEYAKEIIAKDRFENRISKVLPHIYKIPFTTIIFGNKVALISPNLENLILLIDCEGFAKTQKSIFEALWDILPQK